MAGSDFGRGGGNEQTLGKLVIGIFLVCGEEPRTLLTDAFSGSWEVVSLPKRGRARGTVFPPCSDSAASRMFTEASRSEPSY